MNFPKDPIILLSYVNTQLRDKFSSLDELASYANIDKEDIIKKLDILNYQYNPKTNQFV